MIVGREIGGADELGMDLGEVFVVGAALEERERIGIWERERVERAGEA